MKNDGEKNVKKRKNMLSFDYVNSSLFQYHPVSIFRMDKNSTTVKKLM